MTPLTLQRTAQYGLMSDDNSASAPQPQQAVDPVQQLLHGGNGAPGQPLTTDQRNERREALLKRQREAREKAQQISQTARANAAGSGSTSSSAEITPAPPAVASATPSANTAPIPGASTPAPAPASAPIATDTPVRENMVQQAVSFLSSPSVQTADESKKTQFLEKKGLTAKEIELARARIAGTASAVSLLVRMRRRFSFISLYKVHHSDLSVQTSSRFFSLTGSPPLIPFLLLLSSHTKYQPFPLQAARFLHQSHHVPMHLFNNMRNNPCIYLSNLSRRPLWTPMLLRKSC